MRKARHFNIATRLETTKRFGLVEDYRISWQPHSLQPPHITVRGRTSVPPEVTKGYVSALLGPFVASRHISVT
ncbi:MAG: hypothetical protein AB1586_00755 [Pseudomonadota bacterium]